MEVIGRVWSIEERDDFKRARTQLQKLLSERTGASTRKQQYLLLMATEMGSNLRQHAERDPRLLLQLVPGGSVPYLDLLALDRGPGMDDPVLMTHDHISTQGSLGVGLGGIKRLADRFALHSEPGTGTVLFTRTFLDPEPVAEDPFAPYRWAAYYRAAPGEEESGDRWSVRFGPEETRFFLIDGLGHGPEAAEASRRATEFFDDREVESQTEVLEGLHDHLRETRGGVAAVGSLNATTGAVQYTGVGNISGCLLHPGGRTETMGTQNGTLGHSIRDPMTFTYECPPGGVVLCHTDGITSRWQLPQGLDHGTAPPGLIAGILIRDHAREQDDAGIVVLGRADR